MVAGYWNSLNRPSRTVDAASCRGLSPAIAASASNSFAIIYENCDRLPFHWHRQTRFSAAFKSNLVTETFIVCCHLCLLNIYLGSSKNITVEFSTVKGTRDGDTSFWFVSIRKQIPLIAEIFSSLSFRKCLLFVSFYGRTPLRSSHATT